MSHLQQHNLENIQSLETFTKDEHTVYSADPWRITSPQ